MTSRLHIVGRRPLIGSVPLPTDDAILVARMGLAALSRGKTSFEVRGETGAVAALVEALGLLGVRVERSPGQIAIQGMGLFGLSRPQTVIDARGSAPVAAVLLGLLVGQSFSSEIWVDSIVAGVVLGPLRDVARVRVDDLNDGVSVCFDARSDEQRSSGVAVETLGAFAWAKDALLLAGLRAGTTTTVHETIISADHLVRALERSKIPVTIDGTVVEVHPPRDDDAIAPTVYEHIGSARLAGFLGVAALADPASHIVLRDVALNPTGPGLVGVAVAGALELLGAHPLARPGGDRQGELVGQLEFGGHVLSARGGGATHFGGETTIRLGEAVLPLIVGVATAGRGEFFFGEMVLSERGGDSRVVGRLAGLLRSAGIVAETSEAGLRVVGAAGAPLRPLQVTTGGDGRLAALATLLALRSGAESVIDDVECLRGFFPRWVGTLKALGASIEVKQE